MHLNLNFVMPFHNYSEVIMVFCQITFKTGTILARLFEWVWETASHPRSLHRQTLADGTVSTFTRPRYLSLENRKGLYGMSTLLTVCAYRPPLRYQCYCGMSPPTLRYQYYCVNRKLLHMCRVSGLVYKLRIFRFACNLSVNRMVCVGSFKAVRKCV